MNLPLLSICIPTYQRSKRLKEAIEGLLSNEDRRLEVIISDNASSDASKEVVTSFSDQRLKYSRNASNIGANLNIIKAASLANGKYFLFLSDEDRLDEKGLNTLLEMLGNDREVTLVFSSIYDDFSQVYYKKYDKKMLLLRDEEKIRHVLFEHSYFSGICLKKDAVDLQLVWKYQEANPDYSYPHLIMTMQAMIKGSCVLMPEVVAIKGADAGSDYFVISPKLENHLYYSPKIRSLLIQHYVDLVEECYPISAGKIRAFRKIAKIAAILHASVMFERFPHESVLAFKKSVILNDRLRFWFKCYSVLVTFTNRIKTLLPSQMRRKLKRILSR